MRGLRFCASALNVVEVMLLTRTNSVLAFMMLNTSRIARTLMRSTWNCRAMRTSVFHRLANRNESISGDTSTLTPESASSAAAVPERTIGNG